MLWQLTGVPEPSRESATCHLQIWRNRPVQQHRTSICSASDNFLCIVVIPARHVWTPVSTRIPLTRHCIYCRFEWIIYVFFPITGVSSHYILVVMDCSAKWPWSIFLATTIQTSWAKKKDTLSVEGLGYIFHQVLVWSLGILIGSWKILHTGHVLLLPAVSCVSVCLTYPVCLPLEVVLWLLF